MSRSTVKKLKTKPFVESVFLGWLFVGLFFLGPLRSRNITKVEFNIIQLHFHGKPRWKSPFLVELSCWNPIFCWHNVHCCWQHIDVCSQNCRSCLATSHLQFSLQILVDSIESTFLGKRRINTFWQSSNVSCQHINIDWQHISFRPYTYTFLTCLYAISLSEYDFDTYFQITLWKLNIAIENSHFLYVILL